MRRTYRSKKDLGGGLDHRDFKLIHENSSAFDAFYIQNIKQTKKDLSCVSSSKFNNRTKRKIRRKKYVKRVALDTESPKKDSETQILLTPDRSLRVNKVLDIFDQLLNSPMCCQNGSGTPKLAKSGVSDTLFNKRKTKTYSRKILAEIRKINCSSTSDNSDSDKENITIKHRKDDTDIKAFDLIIENDANCSKTTDESINRIVQNLPKMNMIHEFKANFNSMLHNKMHINRSNDIYDSVLISSPLSSTPFVNKNRSKSIYKFSPIAFNLNNISNRNSMFYDNTKTDIEYNNRSKHFKKSGDSNQASPIIHLSKDKFIHIHGKHSSSSEQDIYSSNYKTDSSKASKIDNVCQNNVDFIGSCEKDDIILIDKNEVSAEGSSKKNKTDMLPSEPQLQCEPLIIDCSTHTYNEDNSVYCNPTVHQNEFQQDGKSISFEKVSMTATNVSEEAFMGFSNKDTKMPCSTEGYVNKNHSKDHSLIKTQSRDIEGLNSIPCESFKDLSNQLFSFSEGDDKNDNIEDKFASRLSVDQSRNSQCSNNDHLLKSLLDVSKKSEPLLCFSIDDSEYVAEKNDLSKYSNNSHTSSLSVSDNNDCESFYDTCNSDISSEDDTIPKEPVVLVQKLNDAIFRQYCEQKNNSEKSLLKLEYSSKVEFDNTNESDPDKQLNSTVSYKTYSSDKEGISLNYEEERCFVTTRRKVGFASDLDVFNSLDHTSNCDKTSSSKVLDVESLNLPKELGNNGNNDQTNLGTSSSAAKAPGCKESRQTKNSFTTIRNSSTCEDKLIDTLNGSSINNTAVKPGIVLMPGKKWERSLSIYRRMTVTNDNCSHNIFEGMDMVNKGRKYRQSVLNTMEMQESIGHLHDESINSRCSSFISKPCRSTISIIKEPYNSRSSLINTTAFDDLTGFLSEDCNDTIVDLSKLSIADTEITVLEKVHETQDRITTARDYVLRRCNQADAILFDECYPDPDLKNCHKIGEGVYGEVFLWRARDGRARVMKIVPVAGDIKVNGENQKDFQEIISEIVIAMELSALRTPIPEVERQLEEGKDVDSLDLHTIENATDIYNEVLAVRCVYGTYPSRLLDLWDLYDECKGSENDNPAILPVDQQYIVLELANAGQDLESYQFNNAEQAYALFVQVAFGLAVAEEAYQFEHRDLHWGNVLIAPTDQKYATCVLRGRLYRVARCGVAATIIDYSLSRVSLPLAAGTGAAGAALYNDLAHDDSLFGAVGDYQFEVYRLMRDKLGNDWKNFDPYTNILWLHYTVDKMITALRYKRTNTKIHKQYIAKLKGIKNRILIYGSAAQFILTDNELIY